MQKFLEGKPVASGRLAANDNLFHSDFIHEFLCPLEESHPGVIELKYLAGEFKSLSVKRSAEMGL